MRSCGIFSLFMMSFIAATMIIMGHFLLDKVITHIIFSVVLFFLPYILTENFVIKLKYDTLNNAVIVTKMNFYGKLYSRYHRLYRIKRVHRKNNLRVLSFLKIKQQTKVSTW
jgi:hypothetical protein